MCNFEIEYEYPNELSFEEIQDIICKKIARIVISSVKEFSTL